MVKGGVGKRIDTVSALNGVRSKASVDAVVPAASGKQIVPAVADQVVGRLVAAQGVGKPGASNTLDPDDLAGPSETILDRSKGQINLPTLRHCGSFVRQAISVGVRGEVELAVPQVQNVVPSPAVHNGWRSVQLV
jgi:hypothetical protein